LDDISLLVANNLKKLRREKKLSLEKLSEMTGVSKSMLGQIERGESNPTIAVVWKIANGLKISFTSLLATREDDTRIIRKNDIRLMKENGGKYRLYPYFPIENGRSFEIYTAEIDAGGQLDADPHLNGAEEFITVSSGELIIDINGGENHLFNGDSIHFRADKPHGYRNPGSLPTKFHLVIHYTN
jgi:transcriptional regulator with XRE-family HTH domain